MMKTLIILTALLLTGCSSTTRQMQIHDALPLDNELHIGQSILARDTLPTVDYPLLTEVQRSDLAAQTRLNVPDSTALIGVRPVGGKITLAAYKVPMGEEPNMFKVYLVTHNSEGSVIDAIDLGEFHTSEHQGPMRFGGNRFYTTDASISFDGKNRFAVHRVLTLTSLYLKDHTLTEMWRVEWDDDYEITSDGNFRFIAQRETYRTDDVDDTAIEVYKSRTLPKTDSKQ